MAEITIDNQLEAEELLKEEDRDRDLGFGSVVTGRSRQRFLNPDGSFNVRRTGLPFFTSLNLYHTFLSMSWSAFLLLVLLLYFLSNIVFGLSYMSVGDGGLVDTSAVPMANAFLRAFFFSVQTFATIGYGTIQPVGIFPNLIVTIESYYSLLINALITGIVFARFAQPTAKIVFSRVAVVAPYKDITGLMFRLYNGRNNQLINVEAQVLLARNITENGKIDRRFQPLELERKSVTFFPLSWTVVHPIDKNSPLYGITEVEVKQSDAEILILLSAMDETFAQTVHTRTSYKHEQVKVGYKFASIYNEMKDGDPISIDVRKLSKVERADNWKI